MGKRFVIKTKGEAEGKKVYLANQDVIKEKIAYDILALCGVRVPNTYLVEKKNADGSTQLGIASEVLQNFTTLQNAILEKEQIQTQDLVIGQKTIKHHHFVYKTSFLEQRKINNKPIKGLFESLPAFAVIFDFDAVGYVLSNAGVTDEGDYFQFSKIDPGAANLGLTNFEHPKIAIVNEDFAQALDSDLKQGLILKCFSSCSIDDLAEQGFKALFRLKEVFQHASEEEKLAGVVRLSYLQKQHIKDTIKQKAYGKYFDSVELDEMVETVWKRISGIQKCYESQIRAYFDQYPLELNKPKPPKRVVKIRPIEDFLKTSAKITKGEFAPRVFSEVPDETKKHVKLKNTSLLHHAVLHGYVAEVKRLVEKEGACIDARDRRGNSPLFYAIKTGQVKIAKYLLENNATKDSLRHDETLLHMAAKLNDRVLFNLLVNQLNISPDAVDKNKRTPRDIAKKYKCIEILKWYAFWDRSNELKKLKTRCQEYDDFVVARYLLKNNAKAQDVVTILEHPEAYNNNVEVKNFIQIKSVLRNLISDIDTEIAYRKQRSMQIHGNNEFKERICNYEKANKEIFDAASIYFLQQKINSELQDYIKNHKSWFGIHKDRITAIATIKDVQEKCKAAKEPLGTLLGALIFQRNRALDLHKQNSSFHFFTQSSLALTLNGIISQYNLTTQKQEQLVAQYMQFNGQLKQQANAIN